MSALISATEQKYRNGRLMLAATIFINCLLTMEVMAADPAMENSASSTENAPIAEPQATPQETKVKGSVARAIFTSKIVDREPVDDLTELSNDADRVFFFTDLRNLTGQIVTHRWEYMGKTMAEVKFKVGGGPRWRVYSSKNLLPEWTGEWTVTVSDENGEALSVGILNYTQATASTDSGSTAETTTTEAPTETSSESSTKQ